MKKEGEILGVWWLPAASEEQWTGTLTTEPGKSPEITVIVPKGCFDFHSRKAPPVVYGHDDQGRPITLLFPSWPRGHGGTAVSRMTISAGFALLGIEIPSPQALSVNGFTVGVQHLHEWIGWSGFDKAEDSIGSGFNVRYHRPDDQSFTIDADLTLKLCATSSLVRGSSRRTIREDTCLKHISHRGLGMEQCLDLLNAVRQLLHFAVLKPVYPLEMIATKDGYGDTVDGRFIPHDITIWNSIIRKPVEPEYVPDHWLFRFADVKSNFAKFFADWLTFCTDFEEALSCYNTTVYHQLPLEVAHLCLCQALEAYHGKKSGRHEFAVRIQTLAQKFLPHLKGLVADVARFAEEVRDNRNYYTHHDSKILRHGRVVSHGKLHRLNEKLRLLFQMCVLSEMGIPAARFVRLRRQLAAETIDFVF